jgi:cell division inhibitor SulA/protein ImuA
MADRSALQRIFQHPAVWRGNDCAQVAIPSLPSGHAELDALLPGGGWPRAVLTELYAERPGIGEWRLLMPAAARVTRDDPAAIQPGGNRLALIAPPHVPYAPALAAYGVRLSQLIVVQPNTPQEGLWACEQALRSGSCGMVFYWPARLGEREARRLQHAAETGASAGFLLHAGRAPHSSPAALRLALSGRGGRTVVRILKRRGGGLPAPVTLDLFKGVAGAPRAAREIPPMPRLPVPVPARVRQTVHA